jgi:hypothetical protein
MPPNTPNPPTIDEVMDCADLLCDCAVAYVTANNDWARNNARQLEGATRDRLLSLVEAMTQQSDTQGSP